MTELLDEALDISVRGIFIGQLVSNDSLLGFRSLAQNIEGKMSTIQHAVSLVVKSLAMGAFPPELFGRDEGRIACFCYDYFRPN